MTRRHARPMSAHERAQRVRGAAYEGVQWLAFLVCVAAVLLFLVLGYKP